MKNLKTYQQNWYNINAPLGRHLGYPDCCIKAFCDLPPELLRVLQPNDAMHMRYAAGCIDGKFTGFIPCEQHALLITNKQITLASLINNRNAKFPPFPKYAN